LPPYGASITSAQAKQVADAAPARANGWTVVIAIVDPGEACAVVGAAACCGD